jgi:hypothetical protein
MQQELGWSRTTVTGAYSLGLLVSGLAAPHYGSTGGMVSVFVTGARTLAPESAGAISAALGGYDPVLWMLVSGSALGAIAIYVAQWNLHTPNGGSRGRSRRGRAWRLDHWRRSRTPALPGLTRGSLLRRLSNLAWGHSSCAANAKAFTFGGVGHPPSTALTACVSRPRARSGKGGRQEVEVTVATVA